MHIPDGYLSPATCGAAYAVAVPLWMIGLKKVKSALDEESLPFIASLTALSFIIMMFNIPIPGGTSGHAVGASLLAILFGPWVSFVSVSLALLIQALLFGDGGVTTFAANSLGMAGAGAWGGWWIYRAVRGRRFAPFVAGWGSLVLSSVVIGLFLGIQPMIATGADGRPLYFPFGLTATMTALVGAHMLAFGVVEGIFTQLGYRFLLKIEPSLQKREKTI